AGRAVAGFAADAVGGLEADAARPGRSRVAAEAHRRAGRLADAEPLGDRAGARFAKHGISAAVRAGGGRRILPEHDLVLADSRPVALAAAVAGGAAAGGDADIIARGDRDARLHGLCGERSQQQNDRRQSEHANGPEPYRKFAAAPQFVLHAALLPAKEVPPDY